MAVIYAFGDSITYGSWDLEQAGWVNRLRLYIDGQGAKKHLPTTRIFNLGIGGETTDGLVKRFKNEVDARWRTDEAKIIIFAYGANDAAMIRSKNQFNVTPEKFITNFQATIDQAKMISDKIFVINITPVIDELTVNPESKDKSRLNEYVELYNKQLNVLARHTGIELIDVNSAFIASGYQSLLSKDGLHPNEKGHELIAQQVREHLIINS